MQKNIYAMCILSNSDLPFISTCSNEFDYNEFCRLECIMNAYSCTLPSEKKIIYATKEAYDYLDLHHYLCPLITNSNIIAYKGLTPIKLVDNIESNKNIICLGILSL